MYVHTNFQASTSKDCINNRNANCELPFPLSLVCLSFLLNEQYGLSTFQREDIRLGKESLVLMEQRFD